MKHACNANFFHAGMNLMSLTCNQPLTSKSIDLRERIESYQNQKDSALFRQLVLIKEYENQQKVMLILVIRILLEASVHSEAATGGVL